MKINILTDENNIIISWTSYPIDENKPTLKIKDPNSIRVGFDRFENGKLIKDEEGYNSLLLKQSKYDEIQSLKAKLSQTDYKLFKYLEGELSEEEYLLIKKDRQEWRDRINKLEEELNGIS